MLCFCCLDRVQKRQSSDLSNGDNGRHHHPLVELASCSHSRKIQRGVTYDKRYHWPGLNWTWLNDKDSTTRNHSTTGAKVKGHQPIMTSTVHSRTNRRLQDGEAADSSETTDETELLLRSGRADERLRTTTNDNEKAISRDTRGWMSSASTRHCTVVSRCIHRNEFSLPFRKNENSVPRVWKAIYHPLYSWSALSCPGPPFYHSV
jgi:hypothetical protein